MKSSAVFFIMSCSSLSISGVKIVTNVLADPNANPSRVVAAQRQVIAAARNRFDDGLRREHLTAMSERCIVVWGAEMAPVFKSPMVLELGLFPIASLLPHSALRVYVMGERAVAGEVATPDDLARMAEVTTEAMNAGAIGFGTSRTIYHRSSTGGDHDLPPSSENTWWNGLNGPVRRTAVIRPPPVFATAGSAE